MIAELQRKCPMQERRKRLQRYYAIERKKQQEEINKQEILSSIGEEVCRKEMKIKVSKKEKVPKINEEQENKLIRAKVKGRPGRKSK